ncbi:MAG TPA: VWA domain-containing protein, partial [Candidatus Krumholzibacteria bacterium]|nr:VWA domain-containing protein [Candidatus Krumholzibacteria bacterium]
MFRFAYPYVLLLLLLIPLAAWYVVRRRHERSVAYSSLELMLGAGLEAPAWKRHATLMARLLVLALAIVALARPQTGRSQHTTYSEGIDIMLVLDTSGSMQAQDFEPKNRLNVAKEVVKDFISKRPDDRIGLVVFAADAMTQCPLTLDHAMLDKLVDNVDFGMLDDGTAIGVALATACNRLRTSKAKSKVIVLLTDGQNNAGMVDPTTAARVAASLGYKVYTIGVGTRGRAPIPVDDPVFGRRLISMEVDIDEATLKKIAELTHGKYFRATDRNELVSIYDQINQLEKSKVESETYVEYTERFAWFVVPALGLFFLELGLGETVLRETP